MNQGRERRLLSDIPVIRAPLKKFYIESYGCQMNFADSEVVASILQEKGFGLHAHFEEADMIFLNTCSIREKAELTVTKTAY